MIGGFRAARRPIAGDETKPVGGRRQRGKERAADGYVGQARLTECCCLRGTECLVSIVTVSSSGRRGDGQQGRCLMGKGVKNLSMTASLSV